MKNDIDIWRDIRYILSVDIAKQASEESRLKEFLKEYDNTVLYVVNIFINGIYICKYENIRRDDIYTIVSNARDIYYNNNNV